ncbi:putative oxidoreductase C-terminal domain-containing protein [Fodinibius sp.]|uniref:putative oxidoreductase C-terminal domain-containing protein n=1 Tax=Fodinibius sp. TaxID=1872440 RepID=UPI0035666342
MSNKRANDPNTESFTGKPDEIRLMTLDPAHFHAALVQKHPIPQVDSTVYIYGPEGPDLDMHLERIEGFNSRKKNPTDWTCKVYEGDDFLERMLREKPGNVMVTAGNNRKKTEYIKKTVAEGINVLSDKPMAIDKEGWELLVAAFELAEENGVLLYDIMTERKEVTTRIQRRLARREELFGELAAGTPDDPAIVQQNTHHLLKTVSGQTLRRPPWYFDVNQQGEGIVDINTHLADLALWGGFPGASFDYREDVQMLQADRSPTVLSPEQFEAITGKDEFPDYLQDQLVDGNLPYYCNGEMLLTLRGHHTKISAQWNYQAPPGGGDTHFSVFRGTRCNLVIRQGPEQAFKSTLYVEPAEQVEQSTLEPAFKEAMADLTEDYPGLRYQPAGKGWKLEVPDSFYLGHEAHFGKVAEDFFGYLVDGQLPDWEVPNMITKYYITTQARELARATNEGYKTDQR